MRPAVSKVLLAVWVVGTLAVPRATGGAWGIAKVPVPAQGLSQRAPCDVADEGQRCGCGAGCPVQAAELASGCVNVAQDAAVGVADAVELACASYICCIAYGDVGVVDHAAGGAGEELGFAGDAA
jgi:hypothetical protein